MSEEIQNNSVKKCCICNNKRQGEFIIHNEEKYHLCCIEQQQNNWNELKKWLNEYRKNKDILVPVAIVKLKMQELEGKNE